MPKQKFTSYLKDNGWVILCNEKFSNARLFNTKAKQLPPNDYIYLLYSRFLRANKLNDDSSEKITSYVLNSLPLVTGEIFLPNKESIIDDNGSLWVNTYKQYEPSQMTTADGLELFHEYLARLFPDEIERTICVQWMAHIFQKPHERPSWHLLLSSEAGTGKGYLVQNILSPLLCHQTSTVSSYTRLTGQFSTILSETLLVLLDDPKTRSDDQMTKIKSALTEERIFVERKNQAGRMERTYTRIILASNEERPLRLDNDERRWFAPQRMKHNIDKAETQRFISNLDNWIKSPGALDAVHNWFMSVDISTFNHKHVQQSENLIRMIGASKNALDDLFDSYFEEHPIVTTANLVAYIENEGYHRPSNAALTHALCEKYKPMQLTSKFGRKRYWVRNDLTRTQALQFLECTDNAQARTDTMLL